MNTKIIIITCITFCCVLSLQAQSNNKSTKAQNSGTNTTVKSGNKKVEPQTVSAGTNAKKFTFTGSYTMKFTAKDTKGKTSTGEIKSAFEDYRMATIPSFSEDISTNIRSIFDLKDNTMTMLFVDVKKNKKNGMLMKIPKITLSGNSSAPKITASIQKTSETKIIDGYKCIKWLITYSDGAKTTAWVCKDLNINNAEAISYFTTGMKGKKSPINTECANISGCALESFYTAADGSTVLMKMSDIRAGKPDAAFFTTSGFEIADVTGIQFFK